MKMILLLIMLAAGVLFIHCDNRIGPVADRDNEYDSGGNNFLINGIPTIAVQTDSMGWYDFDHTTGTGTIRIFFTADDPNFPHDTVSLRVKIASDTLAALVFTQPTDSFLLINAIKPSTLKKYNIVVTDHFDSTADTTLSITGSTLIPPSPPSPYLTIEDNDAVLTWKNIAVAKEYVVYTSSSIAGPFVPYKRIPNRAEGNLESTTCYYPLTADGATYFIISSVNFYGECRSKDILIARRKDAAIPTPTQFSASKGTYSSHIALTWHTLPSSVAVYEVYRSTTSNGTYHLLAHVANTGTLDTCTYNDTVTMQQVYYYQLAALNSKGNTGSRCSPDSGYITIDNQSIELTLHEDFRFIELAWTPVAGAASYAVYRSSISCKSNVEKIVTTKELSYIDSLTTRITQYYTVVALDSKGKQLTESSCGSGAIGLLGIPEGISISNKQGYSKLTWNTLPGASKYVIYRSLTQCPGENNAFATTTSTSFTDTNSTDKIRYYKIGAIDDANRKGALSGCYTGSSTLLSSPTGFTVSNGTNASVVTLSWTALEGAASYVIYRASNSCTDASRQILGTTTSNHYTDSVHSTSPYFYTVAGRDAEGREGSSSECREGSIQQLPATTNISASYGVYANAITIAWNPVPQAKGYLLYRGISSLFSTMTLIHTLTGTSFTDSVPDTRIYYYRVIAYSTMGNGKVSTYAAGRGLIPPIISANASTDGFITLSWADSISSTQAYIYQSTDSLFFNFIDSTTASPVTLNPTAYVKYYYYVVFRLTSGELLKSSTATVVKPLPAPTGLMATDKENSLVLSWNTVDYATSYVVYRDSRTVAYKEISATSFTDEITDRIRHTYYVTAKNRFGESALSTGVQGGVLITPSTPVLSGYGTVGSIGLQFKYVSGSAPEGYYIYRKDSSNGKAVLLDKTTGTSYEDSTPDFKTYYYMVTAYNGSGTSAFSEEVALSRTLPDPPINVNGTIGESSRFIHLSWTDVPGISTYNIYRRNDAGTYAKIGSSKGSPFTDSTMGENYATLYYYVTSVIDTFESKASSITYGQLFGPPASIGVSGTVSGIYVSWGSRTNTAMYYIYRSATESGTYTLIDSSFTTRYTDTNDLATNNFYAVAAVSSLNGDVSAKSKPSTGIRRKFPNPPTTVSASVGTDSLHIKLSWSAASGATSYKIYRSVSDSFVTMVTVASSDTTVWYDTVPSDTVYYYKIKSVNRGGESSLSSIAGRGYRIPRKVPVAPIEVDTLARAGYVYLTWSMPSKTIAYSGFRVYRAESKTGDYELVSTINSYTQLYFSDTPPESAPTVYWYKIAAVNTKGESALSTAVSGSRN